MTTTGATAAAAAAAGQHVTGKVIVVTGAGGGFGRSISLQAAALGASLVVTDIDGPAAEETASLIVGAGGQAEAAAADVTRLADLTTVAARAVERFGAIDVMVNNAGIMPLAFFADHEQASDAWDRAIDINIKGVVHGISAVHDQMIAQGRGHIINISSIYGNRGVAGSGVYSATKAAVAVLSDALRVESQGKIKVTVVRPTGVPGTGLASGIINFDAFEGITGQHSQRFTEQAEKWFGGTMTEAGNDPDDVAYWALQPDELAAQIVEIIDTPWGLNISDITIRSTGEDYVL